jgi:hypothetical protein
MATRYYGVSRGETAATVAASTTSKNIELAVNDAVSLEKADIVKAFEAIKKAILEDAGFTKGG